MRAVLALALVVLTLVGALPADAAEADDEPPGLEAVYTQRVLVSRPIFPAELRVDVGDVVRFTNDFRYPIRLVSGEGGVADGRFLSPPLEPGARWDLVLATPGDVPYFVVDPNEHVEGTSGVLRVGLPADVSMDLVWVFSPTGVMERTLTVFGSAADRFGQVQGIEASIDGGPWRRPQRTWGTGGGMGAAFEFDADALPPGPHVARMRAHEGIAYGAVAEARFTSVHRPDLAVESLSVTGEWPARTVRATVRTVGLGASNDGAEVMFARSSADGPRGLGRVLFPALAPGEAIVVSAPWDTRTAIGAFDVHASAFWRPDAQHDRNATNNDLTTRVTFFAEVEGRDLRDPGMLPAP